MDAIDALVEDLLAGLPGEVRREAGGWIASARASAAAEVERDLLLEARAARERFELAAASVERMIGE